MYRILLFVLVLAIGNPLSAQNNADENEKIAKAYIAAYNNWDFEAMSKLHHDSIHFHDPTAEVAFANGSYKHDGKAAVKGFFSGVFNNGQPEHVKLVVKETFSSVNIFIFHSDFECVLPGSWFGKDVTEKVFVSIPLDTILEIKDGKVFRHTDYGDYSSYARQIQSQISN